MDIRITLPEYKKTKGIQLIWEPGAIIKTSLEDSYIHLCANKEGLISLAQQFLTLAQDGVPATCHIHYDDCNSLESGSIELVVEKQDLH